MTKEWKVLCDAVGNREKLATALGVSASTLYRLQSGQVEFDDDTHRRLVALCKEYVVDNPLERAPQSRVLDLSGLRVLGETLMWGFPVAASTREDLLASFSREQLQELKAASSTPTLIRKAVSYLLKA